MKRDYVSMATVATSLDVSVRTVRRWIAEGRLTGYRVGPRMVRLDPEEVELVMHRRIPTA